MKKILHTLLNNPAEIYTKPIHFCVEIKLILLLRVKTPYPTCQHPAVIDQGPPTKGAATPITPEPQNPGVSPAYFLASNDFMTTTNLTGYVSLGVGFILYPQELFNTRLILYSFLHLDLTTFEKSFHIRQKVKKNQYSTCPLHSSYDAQ